MRVFRVTAIAQLGHHVGLTLLLAAPIAAQPVDLTVFPNEHVITSTPKAQFSGALTRIVPPGPLLLGQGYSTLSFAPRGTAIIVGQSTVDRPELQIAYSFELIDSYSELSTSLQLEASASAHYGAGSASARLNLLQTATIRNQSVYILVSYRVTNKIAQLSSYSLNSAALSRLKDSPGAFYSTYGDGFVQRIGLGSELYALLQIDSKENKSRQDVRAEIEASYAAFEAQASFTSSIQKMAKNNHIKILYAQSGGNWGEDVTEVAKGQIPPTQSRGGVLILTPDELILRVRQFTREARDNPDNAEIIWADVLDYAACSNMPSRVALFNPTGTRWVLTSLGALNLELRQIERSWSYYLQNSNLFGQPRPGTLAPTDDDLALLSDLERRIDRTIEYLSLNPHFALDPELTKVLQMRLLAESSRRAEQSARLLRPAVTTYLTEANPPPTGVAESLLSSCLARATASAQLACLLLRSSPTPLELGTRYRYVAGSMRVNGNFDTPQAIVFPADFVDNNQVPETWIDLVSKPGHPQFDLAHSVTSRSATGVTFLVCVRKGFDPTCGCQGYDQVEVQWVARRRESP